MKNKEIHSKYDVYKQLSPNNGFTLVELVIVVAILAILVGIIAPSYSKYVERSRESVDLENVRTAYMEVMDAVHIENGDPDIVKTVQLKQRKAGWQSMDTVTIAGISHTNGEADTANWKGDPVPGGVCEVSIQPDTGVLFDWKGGDGENGGQKKYAFNINGDLYGPLNKTDILEELRKKNNQFFEIDSTCPSSSMKPKVAEQMENDSLLQCGTWVYMGSASNENKRYLLWTSVDTNKTGKDKTIPVIMATADGRYYITETKTAQRTDSKGVNYITIADQNTYRNDQKLTQGRTEYTSLQAAYDAYEKLLTEEQKYADYKDTLPK